MASHYITNKHAINGFTRAVAFEYGTAGITYEQYKEHCAHNTAIKRLVTLEEVASLALYVASPEGAATTGPLLDVSGGTSV